MKIIRTVVSSNVPAVNALRSLKPATSAQPTS